MTKNVRWNIQVIYTFWTCAFDTVHCKLSDKKNKFMFRILVLHNDEMIKSIDKKM